ncbi:MAG: type 1 glutamine amidotransferase [Rhodobacteraceae bacterium]|nr:type 1 glutamine amidotransferase [Paracoccaceae bacterium]
MRIGILQTGPVPGELVPKFGQYGDMFRRFLSGHGFNFRVYDVNATELPAAPDECDGWLITGSKYGVYEHHPWIAPLENHIRAVHIARLPMAGVCFGHQIIAQALGGRVRKFSGGWSVGRVEYDFADGRTVPLFSYHQDQVTELPEGAHASASSGFCRYAGFTIGHHITTLQPHPEFTPGYMTGLLEHRAKGVIPEDMRKAALACVHEPVAGADMAARFAAFFKARTAAADRTGHAGRAGGGAGLS